MIDYIKGELASLTPVLAVVEAGGVGYALNISLNTYALLQQRQDKAAAVKLFVHEALSTGGRDDSFTLYGFCNEDERTLYRLLITVSGVGANTARMILSSLSPDDLNNAIANGDELILKAVKGIGLKTAQRIIIDLKDKLPVLEGAATRQDSGERSADASVNAEVKQEAISALTMLGFAPAPTAKVVVALLQQQPGLTVEQVVKQALKQIK